MADKAEETAAEKLAATLAGTEDEGKPGDGKAGEGSTEAAGSSATGTDAPAEGEDTDPPKATEDAGEPEKLTKPDGSPFTRTDLTALQTALKAARKEARDAQGEVATVRAKTGDRTIEQIETEAATAAELTWKPRLVAASARAELRGAGLALPEGREAETIARAIRLLDVDALTVGEDGAVDGLADQIEGLRVDFPALFEQTAPRRVTSRAVNGADRQTGGSTPKTAAELIAASLIG